MSWLSKVSSPRIRKHLPQQMQGFIDISKKQKVLWNAIRQSGAKVTLFHGTSEIFFENMKQKGGLITPLNLGTVEQENRKANLDKVFLTRSIDYAFTYSNRAKGQSKSPSVVLTFDVPLYYLEDVKASVFGYKLYNEFPENVREIKNIIADNNYDYTCIEKIKNYIENISRNNEFLCWIILPLRFLKDKWTEGDEPTQSMIDYYRNKIKRDPNESIPNTMKSFITQTDIVEGWTKYIEMHPNQWNLIPEDIKSFIPQDIKNLVINFYIKQLEYDPRRLKQVPEDISQLITKDDIVKIWTEHFKSNPWSWQIIPRDIKPLIPNELVVSIWTSYLKEHLNYLFKLPKEIQFIVPKDAVLNAWIEIIKEQPHLLDYAPNDIKTHIEQRLNQKQSYSSWFGKIASPRVRKHLPQSVRGKGSIIDTSKINISKKQKALWNAIRQSGVKVNLFHGTSVKFFEDIQEKGGLITPVNLGTAHQERRDFGKNHVFLTSSISYARVYSKRAKEQSKSSEVILTFEVPLYYLTEVKSILLGYEKQVYNEMSGNVAKIKKIIVDNDYSSKCINEIKTFIESSNGESNEFTCWIMLPLRFLKDKWVEGETPSQKMIDSYIERLKREPYEFNSLPEDARSLISQDVLIGAWVEFIKKNPSRLVYVTDYLRGVIPKEYLINIWIDHIKEHPENWDSMPGDIRQLIPVEVKKYCANSMSDLLEKWISAVTNDDASIGNLFYTWNVIPHDLKSLISKESIIKASIEFIKKYSLSQYLIPNDIKALLPIDLINSANEKIKQRSNVPPYQHSIQSPKQSHSSWFLKSAQPQDPEQKPVDYDKMYDMFRSTYEKSTGTSWDKEKFLSRARNWKFYGDDSGYIAVRPQKSGLYKMVGSAGNPRAMLRGYQQLTQEGKPTWGMVTKEIKDMAIRMGMVPAPGLLVKMLLPRIDAGVFGGAQIKKIGWDGAVTFEYKDVGESTKYFVANKEYYKWLLTQGVQQGLSLPSYLINVVKKLL